MDSSLCKTLITKRGLKYSYASVPAEGTPKDTLLFIHGFPLTSYDWRNQVEFFKKAGFALIIPDMLGTGELGKEVDAGLFKFKDMAADIIDILDAENVGKAIVIGHDWSVAIFDSHDARSGTYLCARSFSGAVSLHPVWRATIQSASGHLPLSR